MSSITHEYDEGDARQIIRDAILALTDPKNAPEERSNQVEALVEAISLLAIISGRNAHLKLESNKADVDPDLVPKPPYMNW